MNTKDRWTNMTQSQSWPYRYKEISKRIQPGSSVLDIGCGMMELKQYLPLNCKYVGLDMVARGDKTLIYDLNNKVDIQKLLDSRAGKKRFDYAVCSGVLEYLNRPLWLPVWLGELANTAILSYYAAEIRDDELSADKNGWANNYTYSDIINGFVKCDFDFIEMITISKTKQKLFFFKNLNINIEAKK